MLQARSAHLQSTKGQTYKNALEGERGTPTCEHCSGLGRGEAPPNSWPLPLQFDGVVHETAGQAGRTMGDRRHRFEHRYEFNISDCVSTPRTSVPLTIFARAGLSDFDFSIFVIRVSTLRLLTRDRRSVFRLYSLETFSIASDCDSEALYVCTPQCSMP